jgi:membrane protein
MGLKEQLRQVYRLGGLSPKELVRRVAREISNDNVTGRSAQLAYYFLFSMFPFLLFLIALLGYVPIPDLLDQIMALLAPVLPGEAHTLLRDTVHDLVTNQKGGLLSFGIVVALWSASAAVAAIADSLNRAYSVSEGRPYWKVRGIAILLTVALAVMLIASMVLIMFGPQLGHLIAAKVGLGTAFDVTWNVLRWPVILFLLVLATAIVYYFAPDVEQDWKWITPGSLLAVVAWILASLAFSYYVNNFGNYNATYGSIGAVIVLLTWMYLTGFFLLVGGEINAEIENAAAGGKNKGEKAIPKKA